VVVLQTLDFGLQEGPIGFVRWLGSDNSNVGYFGPTAVASLVEAAVRTEAGHRTLAGEVRTGVAAGEAAVVHTVADVDRNAAVEAVGHMAAGAGHSAVVGPGEVVAGSRNR